jgi:hypothetical protein
VKALPSDQARRLASELLERHGETNGRQAFLKAIGRPPYTTAFGAAEAMRIWNEAIPAPKAKSPRLWYPPAVQDPTGRDRWQIVRSLVDYGIRPASLAACVVQLLEAGMDREEAIEWGHERRSNAIANGRANLEPWVEEVNKKLASL